MTPNLPLPLQTVSTKAQNFSNNLEAVLKTSSTIECSPKIKLSNTEDDADLQTTNNYEKATLSVKVFNVDEPETVPGGLRKQDVFIADNSSTSSFMLWEADIGSVQEGMSYRLTDVLVRSYRSTKYLSMPKSGATITTIPDIGEVNTELQQDTVVTINKAVVIAALSLETYSTCTCIIRNTGKLIPGSRPI